MRSIGWLLDHAVFSLPPNPESAFSPRLQLMVTALRKKDGNSRLPRDEFKAPAVIICCVLFLLLCCRGLYAFLLHVIPYIFLSGSNVFVEAQIYLYRNINMSFDKIKAISKLCFLCTLNSAASALLPGPKPKSLILNIRHEYRNFVLDKKHLRGKKKIPLNWTISARTVKALD